MIVFMRVVMIDAGAAHVMMVALLWCADRFFVTDDLRAVFA